MNAAEVITAAISAEYAKLPADRYPAEATLTRAIRIALAAADFAVVALPHPNCDEDDLLADQSAAWIDLTLGAESVAVVDDEVTLTAEAIYYGPNEARAIACALLAAADAAEVAS